MVNLNNQRIYFGLGNFKSQFAPNSGEIATDLTHVQKVQYCNHAPTKSVIKPQNQWIYAKNAFYVQLSLVSAPRTRKPKLYGDTL